MTSETRGAAPAAPQPLTPFAIHTSDAAWMQRNGATVRGDGWVTFSVPAADIEVFTFCRNDHLRYRLRDVPSDFGCQWAVCPAVIVPGTARLLGASDRLSDDALARRAEVEQWRQQS